MSAVTRRRRGGLEKSNSTVLVTGWFEYLHVPGIVKRWRKVRDPWSQHCLMWSLKLFGGTTRQRAREGEGMTMAGSLPDNPKQGYQPGQLQTTFYLLPSRGLPALIRIQLFLFRKR